MKAINYFGLIVFFCGLSLFFIGQHNIDICSNLIYINSELNTNILETNFLGQTITPERCYKDGLMINFISIPFIIIGIILLEVKNGKARI